MMLICRGATGKGRTPGLGRQGRHTLSEGELERGKEVSQTEHDAWRMADFRGPEGASWMQNSKSFKIEWSGRSSPPPPRYV